MCLHKLPRVCAKVDLLIFDSAHCGRVGDRSGVVGGSLRSVPPAPRGETNYFCEQY